MIDATQADLSAPTPPRLTARQAQILDLICTGRTQQEVADLLGIAVGTVKARCQAVYARLDVPNRYAAAAVWGKIGSAELAAHVCQDAFEKRRRACPECGGPKDPRARLCRDCAAEQRTEHR